MEAGRHVATDQEQSSYCKLDLDGKEFRTLLLEAGEGEDRVCCELQHVSLQDYPKPQYETISYVWGDPAVRGTIFVHGRATDVPASTERVLKRFRNPVRDRVLWIDAVCINQADPVERGQQVAMMADIYANTFHGLIWLGEDDDRCAEKATGVFEAVIKHAGEETDGFRRYREIMHDKDGIERYAPTLGSLDLDYGPMLSFLSSPWFRRLWVSVPRRPHGSPTIRADASFSRSSKRPLCHRRALAIMVTSTSAFGKSSEQAGG